MKIYVVHSDAPTPSVLVTPSQKKPTECVGVTHAQGAALNLRNMTFWTGLAATITIQGCER